jgi:hypothetical protein
MKKGSKKYGTEVMKENEVVLFVEAALPNCDDDISEAVQDMRMIDTLFHMKRLYLRVHGHIKTTQAGFIRKGSTLYDAMNSIIDGRVNGAFDY